MSTTSNPNPMPDLADSSNAMEIPFAGTNSVGLGGEL